MKSKILGLFGISIFLIAIFAVFASAANFTLAPNSLNFNKNIISKTFTITNTNATGVLNITLSPQQIADTNGKTVTINFNKTFLNIPAGNSTTVKATTYSLATDILLGTFSKVYTINETGNSNNSQSLTLSFSNSFCSNGSINDTNLRLRVDINNRGQGDDNTWMPLDSIEVRVGLENNNNLNGNGDLNSVRFRLGLFKEGLSNNIINDMIWANKDEGKVNVGDINEGDSKKYTFKFRVDPREVKNGNYILRVKAYPKRDENGACIDHSDDLINFGSSDTSANIRISEESDKNKMVVVDEKSYPLVTNAFCGEQVTLPVDVYNIGDRDFNDQVKVTLVNKELGINENETALGDLNKGEKTNVRFSLNVPKDAQEKTYTLSMRTFYDYNKDNGVYDEVSYNTFNSLLKVAGNCVYVSNASVNANLVSGGKAGESLVVKALVTNTGDKKANYLVNTVGYSSWASSSNTVPTTFTLSPGESKDVLITLNVKNDASGEKLFDLKVLSGNELVKTQPVSVSIEKQGFFAGGTINVFSGSNTYLWLLGIINAVLVIVIIFVAVKVLRK